MNEDELYDFLKEKFDRVVADNDLGGETVTITPDGGELTASFRGSKGEVETKKPSSFSGTLSEILKMNLTDCRCRALFLAAVNAVMCSLGLATRTTHCTEKQEPGFCAKNITSYLAGNYGSPKIALIGPEGEISSCLMKTFAVRVLPDSSLGNKDTKEAVDWADLVLCEGSVICDGTLCDYLSLDKEVIFYGTSLSGTAEWLGVKRLCF